MKSIPTIFLRDKLSRQVKSEKLRMVSWVFEGKGVATRKWDGVAIKVEGGKVFRRYEWVEGAVPPAGFVRVQDPDPKRPHMSIPGWAPVPITFLTSPKGKDEKALNHAWNWLLNDLKKIAFNNKKVVKVVNPYAPAPVEPEIGVPDGTYELCGPDIHGNHDGFKETVLMKHGEEIVKHVPRTFEKLQKFLEAYEGEGIVWHYNTGGTVLMAKIKRRDFGLNVRLTKEDKEMAYGQLLIPANAPAGGKIPDVPIPVVIPNLHVSSIQEVAEIEDPILAQL